MPSRQSAFLVSGGYRYYRYATETDFGVARVDADGVTESVISATRDGYENHLNFAFCLDGSDVYFGYTQGTLQRRHFILKSGMGRRQQRLRM